MESGNYTNLPAAEADSFKQDLLDQASNDNVKLDIKVVPNPDGTVNISWTVKATAADPATAAGGASDPPATPPATPRAVTAPAASMPSPVAPVPWPGSVPDQAVTLVKNFEKFSAKAYTDNLHNVKGTWTIGYGSTFDSGGNRVTQATPDISEDDALALLARDLKQAANDVHALVHVSLATHEAASLISWTYNLGKGALAGSTLLSLLNADNRAAVPSEMRKWINQGSEFLLGLLRRRWAEAALFLGVDAQAAYDASQKIGGPGDWPPFALADVARR